MEPIAKLNSYINQVIPYAWDDSESYFEFMAKVLQKLNEVIAANNDYFAVDLQEYATSIINGWKNDGTLELILSEGVLDYKVDKSDYNTDMQLVNQTINDNKTATDTAINGIKQNIQDDYIKALRTKIRTGQNAVVAILSDSTSNDGDEWADLTTRWLANQFAEYSTDYMVFDDDTKSYPTVTRFKQGTAVPAATSVKGTLSTPNKDSFNLGWDLDIAIKYKPDSIASSVDRVLMSKEEGAGARSWVLELNTLNRPILWYTTNGTDIITDLAQDYIPDSIMQQTHWVKCTVDGDDGTGNRVTSFFYSIDGGNWTACGTVTNPKQVSGFFNGSAPIRMMTRAGTPMPGVFYEAWVKSSIDGPIIAYPKITTVNNPFTDAFGNTWTFGAGYTFNETGYTIKVLNASVPGATSAYSNDDVTLAKELIYDPDIIFISYGQNHGGSLDIRTGYSELITKIRSLYPYTSIVFMTQNPQLPNDYSVAHDVRNGQIPGVATAKNCGLIDVYTMFKNNPEWQTEWNGDTWHPSSAGSAAWADMVKEYLEPITY